MVGGQGGNCSINEEGGRGSLIEEERYEEIVEGGKTVIQVNTWDKGPGPHLVCSTSLPKPVWLQHWERCERFDHVRPDQEMLLSQAWPLASWSDMGLNRGMTRSGLHFEGRCILNHLKSERSKRPFQRHFFQVKDCENYVQVHSYGVCKKKPGSVVIQKAWDFLIVPMTLLCLV